MDQDDEMTHQTPSRLDRSGQKPQVLSDELMTLLIARERAAEHLMQRLRIDWPLGSLVVAEIQHKGSPQELRGHVTGHETILDRAVVVVENVRSGAERRLDVRWTKMRSG